MTLIYISTNPMKNSLAFCSVTFSVYHCTWLKTQQDIPDTQIVFVLLKNSVFANFYLKKKLKLLSLSLKRFRLLTNSPCGSESVVTDAGVRMEPDVQIRPGAGDHFWEGCTTKLSKQWCCVINAIMYLHKNHDLNTEQRVQGTLL